MRLISFPVHWYKTGYGSDTHNVYKLINSTAGPSYTSYIWILLPEEKVAVISCRRRINAYHRVSDLIQVELLPKAIAVYRIVVLLPASIHWLSAVYGIIAYNMFIWNAVLDLSGNYHYQPSRKTSYSHLFNRSYSHSQVLGQKNGVICEKCHCTDSSMAFA